MFLGLSLGILTAIVAVRRGFNPFAWFLAGGLIGLLALAFLKPASDPALADGERAKRRRIGNGVGLTIGGASLVLATIIALSL